MGAHGVGRTSRMGCPLGGIGVSLGKQPMGHPGHCLWTTSGPASRPEVGSEVSARKTLVTPAWLFDQLVIGVVLVLLAACRT